MIKRETDYAIRTVLCLARSLAAGDSERVSTEELSHHTGVPYRFLRKIVLKLVRAGIVESRRGKNGGLLLGRSPRDISLLDLMQVVEPESVLLNQCMVPDSMPCQHQHSCGLHKALGKIQFSLQRDMADVSLMDMTLPQSASAIVHQ